MGEKRNRLAKFLSQHPLCCFCGGLDIATTQDHLPPRSVFDNKKWPEGYVFPACLKCNNDSSKFDSIFALVSRIYPTEEEADDVFRETEKLIKAYIEEYPEEASSIFFNANQKRRLAKKYNLQPEVGGTYGELPIVKIPEQWIKAIDKVSAKIVKAIHYKHSGRVIPKTASIKTRWWSNAQYMHEEFPKELSQFMEKNAPIKRDSLNLNKQFSYTYQISEDGCLGMYSIYFRMSFYVVGLVSFEANAFNNIAHEAKS